MKKATVKYLYIEKCMFNTARGKLVYCKLYKSRDKKNSTIKNVHYYIIIIYYYIMYVYSFIFTLSRASMIIYNNKL